MTIVLAHQWLQNVECSGYITVLQRSDGAWDLICNACGQPIATAVPFEKVEPELARLAETCGYSVYPCAHCGALNICTEIALTDALVCPKCQTPMVKSSPISLDRSLYAGEPVLTQ